MTSPSCPPFGRSRYVTRPASDDPNDQRRRIRRAEPQVSGFYAFEEVFSVLLDHAAFGQLHQHLRQRNGAKFVRARQVLPRLWFLRSAV